MSAVIIIPARMGSSRLPGKPLQMIAGRPLIEQTWRAATRSCLPVLIATDDDEIAAIASDFGAEVQMTGECANGTERCAQAVEKARIKADIIINWQGDSPLCDPAWCQALIEALEDAPAAHVATPVQMMGSDQTRRWRADLDAGFKGATSAAVGRMNRAVYFSKTLLPADPGPWMHVGIYAYRRFALENYGFVAGPLEKAEGLEQLRWLEKGHFVRAVPVDADPIWEVNNPGDIAIVEAVLERRDAIA